MYRNWLKMAVASGEIQLPRGLDMASLYTAVYSGPVMPWIDPVKEANARKRKSEVVLRQNLTGCELADAIRMM